MMCISAKSQIQFQPIYVAKTFLIRQFYSVDITIAANAQTYGMRMHLSIYGIAHTENNQCKNYGPFHNCLYNIISTVSYNQLHEKIELPVKLQHLE
jgi:hypothetical protein